MMCYCRVKKLLYMAFTLVELLIVISIILILMSILLPSLKKSKSLATQITCANNLKQVCLAQSNYADDYTFYAAGKMGDYIDFNQHWWHHKIRTYLGSDKVPTGWLEAHDLARIPPLWCPETQKDGSGSDTFSYAPSGFGYMKRFFGLNPCILSTTNTGDPAPHFIRPTSSCANISPSQIMFTSELGFTTGTDTGYVHYCIRNGTYFNADNAGTFPAFRHSGKKNVLFLDGHVGTVFRGEMDYSNYLK